MTEKCASLAIHHQTSVELMNKEINNLIVPHVFSCAKFVIRAENERKKNAHINYRNKLTFKFISIWGRHTKNSEQRLFQSKSLYFIDFFRLVLRKIRLKILLDLFKTLFTHKSKCIAGQSEGKKKPRQQYIELDYWLFFSFGGVVGYCIS